MAHGKQLHPETGKVAANESRFVQPSYLIFLWCSSRPFPFVRLFLLAQSFNKGGWYERLVARKNSNRFEPLQWSDLACLLISGRAIIPSGLQLPRVSCAPCFVVTSLTLDSTTKHDPSWREKSKQWFSQEKCSYKSMMIFHVALEIGCFWVSLRFPWDFCGPLSEHWWRTSVGKFKGFFSMVWEYRLFTFVVNLRDWRQPW